MKIKNSILISVLISMVALSLTGERVTKHKEMYFNGDVKYINRDGGTWDKAGRIVGILKNPPQDLTITFYNLSKGQILYTYKAPGKMYIYMSRFLPAGTYNVTFKSEGFSALTKKKLKVKKNTDCILNVRFSNRVFTNW